MQRTTRCSATARAAAEAEYGYYHEYTVKTPGERARARRIVAGRGGEFYYSPDHYNSFRLVRE